MEKKLQVRNLRISFRTVSGKLQAVRDISFDLHKGETLAIVGESGSGKSVTSKAILGILAGNSIIEGGEILYDGQDLLKIGEEDFYRLRGDKISMIFQDPLSSLNPIMRIGKQLTEAMLLKGKARQRASKKSFSEKLKQLENAMIAANPDDAAKIKEKCALFEKFVHQHTRLEKAYNEAYESAQEALVEIEDMLFLIEKNALKDPKGRAAEVKDFAIHAVNPYVVASGEAIRLKSECNALCTAMGAQSRTKDFSAAVACLKNIQQILSEAVAKTRPDFFAIGFAVQMGKYGDAVGNQEAQNAYYAKYLEDEFMAEFSRMAEQAITVNDAKYAELRGKAAGDVRNALERMEKNQADERELDAMVDGLTVAVNASINPLNIVKDSVLYTFGGSLKSFVNTYHEGVRTNGAKIKEYEKQMAKYNALIKRGRKVDWKVAEPSVIDLELVRQNIVRLITRLLENYEAREREEAVSDKAAKAERLIEFLKTSASGMVDKVTKRSAKNKALKLMEEVGIPEPRKRYKDYPFQFSGGMRQRIVIAIALAANPDILICDEPTTALDVTIQAQILELINRLKKERSLSVIFITHDLGVVANMADRIAVMYAGKIVEYGTAEEVFYEPAHPYTWALLSSMPDLDTKEKLEAIPGTPPNMIYPPKGDAFADRNRYALKIDYEMQPPAFPITDTHWAATWLLHPDAPKTEMPKTVSERIRKMKARVGGEANV